ncbi:MAG: hypothetical protein SPJ23_04075 [Eubacteriales bacterium]|nr:hypothetical protein [Eubacteriales bacterium]
MKKSFWYFLLVACVCCSLLLLAGCNPEASVRDFFNMDPRYPDYTDPGTIRVSFGSGDGIRITSQNPIEVVPGGDAVFYYELEDGVVLDGVPGAEITEDGRIVLSGVNYPTTLRAQIHYLDTFSFSLENADQKGGSVTSDRPGGTYWDGTVITLSAAPADNFVFAGFSADAPLSENGTLLSESAPYSVTLSADTKIYANFTRIAAFVTLEKTEGLTPSGETLVTVPVGGDIDFSFSLDEGYVIDSVSGGKLVGNRVVVRSVQDDTTVRVVTRQLDRYTCTLASSDPAHGSAAVTSESASVWQGESITVTATGAPHYVFVSYTKDKPASQGGTVVSQDSVYTFVPDGDILLYANFILGNLRVTLDLSAAPGVTCHTPLTVETALGATAVFDLSFSLGTVVDSVSGGVLNGNTLTVTGVSDDCTVVLRTHVVPYYTLRAESSNPSYGTVTLSSAAGVFEENATVTASARETETGRFRGFSVGAPLASGGTLVSSSESYTFRMTADLVLYANFEAAPYDPALTATAPAGKWLLFYHPNGGISTATNNTAYRREQFSNEYYLCPNTLPDCNYFTRKGYVLVGYNTREDGTGTYYGLGWNVVMPEDRDAISLYCMWEKESPATSFTYYRAGSSIILTGYRGTEETVVIPEKIGGYSVTQLAAGFLKNNSRIRKLVISKNVTTIEPGAIVNCSKLQSIHYPDSILSCPDDFYTNCPSYQTLYLQATRYPYRSASRVGTYAIKFERLITAKGRKLVMVSGSNGAWGVDSPALEKLLLDAGYDFSIVNYGCSAGTSALFYLEVISHFVKEGDLVLHQPECSSQGYGWNWINTTLIDFFEGAYDAFSYVDVRRYNGIYSSLSSFLTTRASSGKSSTYEVYCTTEPVNLYGDCAWKYTGTTGGCNTSFDKYEATDGVIQFSQGRDSIVSYCDKLNYALDLIADNGGTVLSSFASVVSCYLKPESRETGGVQQKVYEKAVDTYLHSTRISNVSDYIFDRSLFYNSQWHLNISGKSIRTNRLADDLIAYLSK